MLVTHMGDELLKVLPHSCSRVWRARCFLVHVLTAFDSSAHGVFALLPQHDELVACGRASSISPSDLMGRVLAKGKVKWAPGRSSSFLSENNSAQLRAQSSVVIEEEPSKISRGRLRKLCFKIA
eukprot:5800661-Prymnesium_polylepis.1